MMRFRYIVSACLLLVLTGFILRPKTFTIDTDSSSVTWRWYSGAEQNSGTVYISSGELLADKQTIRSGRVTLDLNSLTVSTVRDLRQNARVTGWLKGREFLDTYNHPVAVFQVASLWHEGGSQYTLNGTLTVKGKVQQVRVPAMVDFQKKKIDILAQVVVDQEKLGMNTRAGQTTSVNTEQEPGEFRLQLHLVAIPGKL